MPDRRRATHTEMAAEAAREVKMRRAVYARLERQNRDRESPGLRRQIEIMEDIAAYHAEAARREGETLL